jgi:hypothetical protein
MTERAARLGGGLRIGARLFMVVSIERYCEQCVDVDFWLGLPGLPGLRRNRQSRNRGPHREASELEPARCLAF